LITRDIVRDTLRAYLAAYPGETERLRELGAYLEAHDRIFDRANPAGHLTTSAFLADPAGGCLLLIRHKALGRWLQPGGHVEGDATLIDSALRELVEETGLPASAVIAPPPGSLPVDIDIHIIPANPRKGEPEHPHFDFRYRFQLRAESELVLQEAEVTDAAWFALDTPEVVACLGSEGPGKFSAG
jgi:8-oxo-dGTP pyrophosphatase MutT (NUDIX family)